MVCPFLSDFDNTSTCDLTNSAKEFQLGFTVAIDLDYIWINLPDDTILNTDGLAQSAS